MEYYKLNDTITQLWENNSIESIKERVPTYYAKPKLNRILFIGLNPAFQQKDIDLYRFEKNISQDRVNYLANLNSESKLKGNENYYAKYYNILHEINDSILQVNNVRFEHCDVFLMRETDSKEVKNSVENEDGSLNEFGLEQIAILQEHIANAEPSLIIIPNSMSSRYYKQYLLNNQSFNREKGCYFSDINNKKIPTILCGSWQYGRIDDFTKEILIHHIRRVFDSNE